MEVFKCCKVRQYANAKRERQGSWYCKKSERTFFASAAFWSKHGERGREKVEEEGGGEGDPDVGGSDGVGGGEKEGANSKEEDRAEMVEPHHDCFTSLEIGYANPSTGMPKKVAELTVI